MLQRIALAQSGTEEASTQAVERAFMISADNAHAWHPNYSEKFDPPIIQCLAAVRSSSSMQHKSMQAMLYQQPSLPASAMQPEYHANDL